MVGQVYNVNFTKEQCEWLDLAENAIDGLMDSLYDEVGDAAEWWDDQIKSVDKQDLNKRLGKTIMEWIEERVGQPNVFQVNDVEVVMEEMEEEDGCY